MWFWVGALRVKTVIFGEGMKKSPLPGRHRLEPETLLLSSASKDSELSLQRLCPTCTLSEELESGDRVGDMVIHVRFGIDIERLGQLLVTLEPKTLIIALESFLTRLPRVVFRG